MIERLFPEPFAQQRLYGGPLASYVDGFADRLAIQGYAEAAVKEKLRLIAHLRRWLQKGSPQPSLSVKTEGLR